MSWIYKHFAPTELDAFWVAVTVAVTIDISLLRSSVAHSYGVWKPHSCGVRKPRTPAEFRRAEAAPSAGVSPAWLRHQLALFAVSGCTRHHKCLVQQTEVYATSCMLRRAVGLQKIHRHHNRAQCRDRKLVSRRNARGGDEPFDQSGNQQHRDAAEYQLDRQPSIFN